MPKSNQQDDNVIHSTQDKNESQLYEQSRQQSLKLPKITRPLSRNKIMSRKQHKPSVILPALNLLTQQKQQKQSIQNLSQENQQFRNTDNIKRKEMGEGRQNMDIYKDDFALDVESKLKMILGGANDENKKMRKENGKEKKQINGLINGEIFQQDDDFEQKINQNKQFIKMHRQQQKVQKNQKKTNQNSIKSTIQPSQKLILNQKINKPKLNNKPQSNYEKKMKQYNYNNSLENKYLQRKKESLGIIIQKPSVIVKQPMERAKSKKILSMKDAIDEAKINFGYKQFKSNAQIVSNQNGQNNKPSSFAINFGNGNNAIKNSIQKMSRKNQSDTRKTEQSSSPRRGSLFDNIQSLLENPIAGVQKHQKLYREIAKKLKNKDMNKLQEQIKQITEKIGISSSESLGNNSHNVIHQAETTMNSISTSNNQKPASFLLTQQPIMQRTARDWKRVQIKDKKNLNYHQSNFDKELDYISFLQQRSSHSLTKFIDQQKIMVELQLHRRFSKSIGKEDIVVNEKQ